MARDGRRNNEIRELEGLVRQLTKRIKQLTRENSKLQRQLSRYTNSEQFDIDEPIDDHLPSVKVSKKKEALCVECGIGKPSVIEIGRADGVKTKYLVCGICKTRKKMP